MSTNTNTPAVRRTSDMPAPAAAEQTVQDMIRTSWSAIAASLPDTMDSKRFARLVFNAVRKTPKLALATAPSMIGSVLTASALGLEIGLNNEAHLVPYKNKWGKIEAQLQVGYGGYAKLFQQHPMARGISTGWVGANDHFEFAYGTSSFLDHRPRMGNRGPAVAFWASYELANGVRDFLVLSPEEVAEIRNKPIDEERDIADPQHWMERKTVLKQVLKLAPKSTKLQWAMVVDEKPGGELSHERVHVAIDAGDVVHGDMVEGAQTVEYVDEVTGEVLDEPPAAPEPQPPAAPVAAPKLGGGVAGEAPAHTGGDTPPPAEPVDDDAEPVDGRPRRILTRQSATIRAECARLGIQADPAEKVHYLSAIAARPITATADLTRQEADQVIDLLVSMPTRQALEAWASGQETIG